MKKNHCLLLYLAVVLFSCQGKDPSIEKLHFKMIKDQAGALIKTYDFISISFTEKTENDSILNQTNGFDSRPVLFYVVEPYFDGDLYTALRKMSNGDSATFKISVDSLKAKMDFKLPAGDKSKYLTYTLKVNDVITRGKLSDSLLNAKIQSFQALEVNRQKKLEGWKIKNFISSNRLKVDSAKSGWYYLTQEFGKGTNAQIGDTAIINYSIKTLDGKVLETNQEAVAKKARMNTADISYKPYSTAIKKNPVSAFDEAAAKFPAGTKAKLIIPSRLAYGELGNKSIQPYLPVVCEFEILKVIKTGLSPSKKL